MKAIFIAIKEPWALFLLLKIFHDNKYYVPVTEW
jgi:hypothetical protein